MFVFLIAPSSNQAYVPAAPLGLSYLAACLPWEIIVQGLDLHVLKWVHGLQQGQILSMLEEYFERGTLTGDKPDCIGLTVYEETLAEGEAIARLAKRFGIYTVAGGIYPTMFPDLMPPVFDYLVRGRGEISFGRLVELLRKTVDEDATLINPSILGVSYQKSGGGWVHQESDLEEENLEALSNILPRRAIFDAFNLGFHYYSARLVSSSGCPYQCSFCCNAAYANRQWMARDVEDILREVEEVVQDPHISEISFSDDQFLGFRLEHYQRALQILERVEQIIQDRNIRINLQVRADHFLNAIEVVPELAVVMESINQQFKDPNPDASVRLYGKPMGGFSLDIGVESNIEERLLSFCKELSVATNLKAIQKAKAMKLDLGVYMVLFTPDLTLEQLEEEIQIYLKEVLDTDVFSCISFYNLFKELIPYKGTAVYDEMKQQGDLLEKKGYSGFHFRDPGVSCFYVMYLYELVNGYLDAQKGRKKLTDRVAEIISICKLLKASPKLLQLAQQVVCVMNDMDLLEKTYQEIERLVHQWEEASLLD